MTEKKLNHVSYRWLCVFQEHATTSKLGSKLLSECTEHLLWLFGLIDDAKIEIFLMQIGMLEKSSELI